MARSTLSVGVIVVATLASPSGLVAQETPSLDAPRLELELLPVTIAPVVLEEWLAPYDPIRRPVQLDATEVVAELAMPSKSEPPSLHAWHQDEALAHAAGRSGMRLVRFD